MPVALIIQIVQGLAPLIVEKGPKFVADIVAILNRPAPTAKDWDELKSRYAQPDPPPGN
ncbi:MAG: hypothetical protein NTY01_09285 [Verrucomicrobia bacterium]|nr:hypothetical protein [Verrucomicrobiota bacterium]